MEIKFVNIDKMDNGENSCKNVAKIINSSKLLK